MFARDNRDKVMRHRSRLHAHAHTDIRFVRLFIFSRAYIVVGEMQIELINCLLSLGRTGIDVRRIPNHIRKFPTPKWMADIQFGFIKSSTVLPTPKAHQNDISSTPGMGDSHPVSAFPWRGRVAYHSIYVAVVTRKLKFIQTNYVTANDLHRSSPAPRRSIACILEPSHFVFAATAMQANPHAEAENTASSEPHR